MRAHYLQHVPFEGLGSIAAWLAAAGYETTGTHFYHAATLPDLHDFDLLVIMGGPMSVDDEREFPWLRSEKAFIRAAVEAGKSILGVCLGAQLIASALGSRVVRNPFKEIGWFPVFGTAAAEPAAFCFPPSVEVFHWHGDTFDLPRGSIHLARSAGCENQAFQLGQSVIGLQFHLETTPASAQTLVAHCRAELSPAQYVQSEATILAAPPETYAVINSLCGDVLTFLSQGR